MLDLKWQTLSSRPCKSLKLTCIFLAVRSSVWVLSMILSMRDLAFSCRSWLHSVMSDRCLRSQSGLLLGLTSFRTLSAGRNGSLLLPSRSLCRLGIWQEFDCDLSVSSLPLLSGSAESLPILFDFERDLRLPPGVLDLRLHSGEGDEKCFCLGLMYPEFSIPQDASPMENDALGFLYSTWCRVMSGLWQTSLSFPAGLGSIPT